MTGVTLRQKRKRPGEKQLEDICRDILEAVPENRITDLIRGRITPVEFTERVHFEMDKEHARLEEALYVIRLFEVQDTDEEIRDAINRDLKRLAVPVRLTKPDRIRKETDPLRRVEVEMIMQEWGAVPYADFNVSDPQAILRVQARQQAGEILSHIAATERDMILAQVELGFTQVQEFSTGRSVAGRTVGQTARGIFPILEATIPVVNPETAALYRTGYTNGLFPRWANAVNNFSDRTAEQLESRGVTGSRAAELVDSRTMRYGNKLRRSRARMIARTETSYALNSARLASYAAALDQGLVNSSATKTWVSGGFDVCPICVPLSGRNVPLNSLFFWSGGFRGGSGQSPPAHPNCRCKTRMQPAITQPPQLIGSNTPGDPFRYQFNDGFVAGINPVI